MVTGYSIALELAMVPSRRDSVSPEILVSGTVMLLLSFSAAAAAQDSTQQGEAIRFKTEVVVTPERTETPRALVPASTAVPGSYRFRGDVQVSVNYQNSPGIPTLAVWNAPNSVIAPVLGRNLSACRAGLTAAQCTASLGVALVPTNSLYREARFNLLGLAVNRNFRVGNRSIRPRFEIGNALNANTVTTVNTSYGPTWQAVRGVITPRTAKLALQMDF